MVEWGEVLKVLLPLVMGGGLVGVIYTNRTTRAVEDVKAKAAASQLELDRQRVTLELVDRLQIEVTRLDAENKALKIALKEKQK